MHSDHWEETALYQQCLQHLKETGQKMDVSITGIVQYLIEHVTIKLGRFVKKDMIIGVYMKDNLLSKARI